jgi:site-specific recombinase XerD
MAITITPRPPGLIQRYREELQTRHYARRTVNTYEQWLRRFLRFHVLRHPRQIGSGEVNAFLSHLAVDLQVSASTQNQALSALLFLYRELPERDLELEGVVRARLAGELTVRDGKGGKDRRTLLPQSLVAGMQEHVLKVRRLHQADLAAGWGRVLMPYTLARKYPNAEREWAWQWVFPQRNRWQDWHLEPRAATISIRAWCRRR